MKILIPILTLTMFVWLAKYSQHYMATDTERDIFIAQKIDEAARPMTNPEKIRYLYE